MMIAFSSAPFGKPGSDDFRQIGDTQANGTVQWGPTVGDQAPDHPPTVLSVRPDGTYKTEPLGTTGAWEVLKFDGSSLTIRPNHGEFAGWPNLGIVIAARAL